MSVEELIFPDGQPRVQTATLAKHLGVSRRRIYDWVKRGRIPEPILLNGRIQWHNLANVKRALRASDLAHANGRKGAHRG